VKHLLAICRNAIILDKRIVFLFV